MARRLLATTDRGFKLGLDGKQVRAFTDFLRNLTRAYDEHVASVMSEVAAGVIVMPSK